MLAATEVLVEAAPGLRAEGGVDVDRLQALAADLEQRVPRAERAVRQLRLTRTWGTPPQVGQGVDEAVAALVPAVEALRGGTTGARLAAGLLGAQGPRPLLLALQNNAELRGAGGYASTFATGTADGGRLVLDPFRDVMDVMDPLDAARRVPSSPEYHQDFGAFLADTTHWRTWTMSPHVPDVGEVGAGIGELLLDQRPELVVLLDVPAVAALAGLSGRPVVLADGEQVPADRLVELLLVESYADAGDSWAVQNTRRAELRAAAGDAAAQVLSADVDPVDVVTELGRLARGRHLALWSADPDEQEQLLELGLGGAVAADGGDLLHVSVNNLSANKLDYYVDREVEHEVVLSADVAEVRTTVRLAQQAPADLVPYVEGITTPGTSTLRVELSFPPSATFTSLTLDGKPARGDVRFSDDRARAFTSTELSRGETAEVELRYRLPLENGEYALQALPQALARDASLSVIIRSSQGREVLGGPSLRAADGAVRRDGPWAESEHLVAAVRGDRPTGPAVWVDRLMSFWREPIALR